MRSILISTLVILHTLIFPRLAFAATFSLTPNQGNLTLNTTTPVEIKLSSSDPVNVMSAVISYPADLLDITWVKTSSLAFNVPVEQFIGNGQIRVSKGALTPVSGSNIQLVTIGVTPKAAGNATLNFTNSSAIISSSESKNVLDLPSSTGASFTITAQTSSTNSPASTTPAPASTPVNNPAQTPGSNNQNTECSQIESLKTRLTNKYKDTSKIVVRLNTISTLTDSYYQTKLMPKNTLSDYSKYQDQIQTTRQEALVKLSSLQNIIVDFDCASAKNKLVSFKNTIVTLKKDLINYRKANTDLLVKLKEIK